MPTVRETYEKQLEAAGEKLGMLMKSSSESEKERFRKVKSEIDEFAREMEARGKYADRSCLFVSWIFSDPDITNDELKKASKEYIEIDHLLLKSCLDEERGRDLSS
jgi:hypothetical protein